MILLLISFVAGVLTVLAPCILPLLPVIVGGSLADKAEHRKKAVTVVVSLGISVILFTFLLKVSTLFINIPPNFWKWFSAGLIFLIGLTMLFPRLWEGGFMARMSAGSNKLLGRGVQKKNFWGDVLIGAALGPVFSTCSPTYFIVLATVLPAKPVLGVVYLLAYVVGLCLSLFIISFVGQKILTKLNVAADPKSWFKKIIGLLFVLVAVFIAGGLDKKLQTDILDSGFFDVTQIEQKLLQKADGDTTAPEALAPTVDESASGGIPPEAGAGAEASAPATSQNSSPEVSPDPKILAEKSLKYEKAHEFVIPNGYINTYGKAIKLSDYIGKKVVLIDFWTYSCINCQRTTPYLNAWYKEYEDDGLVIVGVHTPEFSFEKVQANVEKAVMDDGIKYPVILDNDYLTWNAYGNRYWPRKYLVDIDGFIVYDHIGEGAYDETEKEIQKALSERAARLGLSEQMPAGTAEPTDVASVSGNVASPETYFGAMRNTYLANGQKGVEGSQDFVLPSIITKNALYLDGTWMIAHEYAESSNGTGKIVFKYDAKNVYMVASSDAGAQVDIYKDDVFVESLDIKDEKLYDIIKGDDYGTHKLEIDIKSGKLKAFTFTFG